MLGFISSASSTKFWTFTLAVGALAFIAGAAVRTFILGA